MRRVTGLVLLAAAFVQAGCSMIPQSRAEYTSNSSNKQRTFTVPRSLDAVIASLDNRIQVCVNKIHRSGTIVSPMVSAQYMEIKRVSAGKAELTYRQRTNNGLFEPEGGYFMFAADLDAVGRQSTKVVFYPDYSQEKLMNALKEWASGNHAKCHGYGGE